MKTKNKNIDMILASLYSIGNRQPISQRFELTKIAHEFKKAQEIIQEQIDQIIHSRFEKDGKTNSIQRGDKEYIELMECFSEIDFIGFSLKELEKYNPSMQELMGLSPVIKEE